MVTKTSGHEELQMISNLRLQRKYIVPHANLNKYRTRALQRFKALPAGVRPVTLLIPTKTKLKMARSVISAFEGLASADGVKTGKACCRYFEGVALLAVMGMLRKAMARGARL